MLWPMRICLIVNPHAGKKQGLAAAKTAARLLGDADIEAEILVSSWPGQTVELASGLDQSAWDGVVAVGGDGTLFEMINGILASSNPPAVPVGQIPVGTGNSFLKDLGVESVEDGVDRLMKGKVRKIDLGHFSSAAGDFYFVNLLGAGFVSNVAYRAGKYRAFGAFSYILGVVEEVIGLTSTPVTLNIDGRVIERDCVFVEICNSRFTGGNMMMAPSAEIDDGLLDVVVLSRVSRLTILKLLPTIFEGKHVDAPAVEVFRGRRILLRSERPLSLTPDGETFGETPIDVTVHRHKLEIFG